jgi:hypothetical protein
MTSDDEKSPVLDRYELSSRPYSTLQSATDTENLCLVRFLELQSDVLGKLTTNRDDYTTREGLQVSLSTSSDVGSTV